MDHQTGGGHHVHMYVLLNAVEPRGIAGVAHFEGRRDAPRLMRGTEADAAYAERIAAGTVGVRLTPTRVVAKRKMSQNKAPEVVGTIRDRLAGDGPFANPALER